MAKAKRIRVLSVRLTRAELDDLKKLARAEGVSESEIVRVLVARATIALETAHVPLFSSVRIVEETPK
jgi:hypothetical protein